MKESPLYQEIMEEGKIENARAFVQDVLKARFGGKAAVFATALNGINDVASLARLHDLAVRCRRLTDFSKGLAAEAPTQ